MWLTFNKVVYNIHDEQRNSKNNRQLRKTRSNTVLEKNWTSSVNQSTEQVASVGAAKTVKVKSVDISFAQSPTSRIHIVYVHNSVHMHLSNS